MVPAMGTDPVTCQVLQEALRRAFGPPSRATTTVSRWHLRRHAHRPGNVVSVLATKAGEGAELWVFDPCTATGHTATCIPVTTGAEVEAAVARIRALLRDPECM
jgi:hypothetical protein